MHLNRKAVDVQRDASRRRVAAGGAKMTHATFGQAVTQRGAVDRVIAQRVQQPRLRGLARQPLIDRCRAACIPSGQLHRRIMGQTIGIVLCRVAQRQTVQSLAQQLDQFVTNSVGPPRIE